MSRRPYWTMGFGLALALGTVPSAQAQFRKQAEPAATEAPAEAKTAAETPKADAPEGAATKDATTKDATKADANQANDRRSPFSDPAQQKRMLRAMVTGQGSMGFGGRSSGGLTSMVLRSPALQEELKLTDEQKKQIEDINKQSGDRLNEMSRQRQDSRENGERFDFNQMRDTFRNMSQQSQDAILQVLTTEQKKRLNQIALQIEGPTALAKPEIGRQVNLSPSQQQQVQAIVNQFTAALEQQRQQMFGGRGGPGGQGGPGGPGGFAQGGPGGRGGPGGFAQGGPGGGPGGFNQGGGPGGFAQGGPGGRGGPGALAQGGPGGGPGGRGFGQGGPGGQGFGQGGPQGRGFGQGGPAGPGGFNPAAGPGGNRFAQGGPGGAPGQGQGRGFGQGGPGGAQGGPGGAAPNTDRRQMLAQMQEKAKKQAEDEDKLLEQTEMRIAKVLTTKQRKSFNSLLGETFDLNKLFEGGMNALFGGGRGGPGGAPGGPGGGRGGRGGRG
jgi:hypothetical protein